MPRRYADYPDAFAGWNLVSSIGAYIFFAGLFVFMYGVIDAFVRKERPPTTRGARERRRWNGPFPPRRRSISSTRCRGSWIPTTRADTRWMDTARRTWIGSETYRPLMH